MGNPSRQQYGKWCRETLVKHLEKEWGELELRGPWIWGKDKIKILARVSKFNKNNRYFYDVYQDDWERWDSHCYLALLMRDDKFLSYVMLNPKESQELLDRINFATDGSKNINVYMPSPGKLYIQVWQDFPLAARIVEIGPIIKSSLTQLPPDVLLAIKKMSPEKIAELIAKIS